MIGRERLIVVTGGPGGGKSTLIAALGRIGFRVAEEAGRKVIREELASGGDALPWGDRLRFAERMLECDAGNHAAASAAAGPTFFDRGAPDVLGYLRLCDLPATPALERRVAELVYARKVFLAPFWAEIFVNDAERKQTPEETRRTAQMMAATYRALGYEIVELPLASVEERVAFVASALGITPPRTPR